MLQILPLLTWFAAITSAVLLFILWQFGELSRSRFGVFFGWFLVAGYCQFFAGSVLAGTVGLVLQTILAIVLVVRWRLA